MSVGAYLGRFGKEIPDLQDDEEYQKWIKQVKKAVLTAIQKQTSSKPEWIEGKESDEQIGLELGGWNNLIQLQRYAAHIQFTGGPPLSPAGDEELECDECLLRYREAMEETEVISKGLKFKHLVMTGDQIRYIPLDFPEPLLIEEDESEEALSIGSSYQLYHELKEINKHLLVVGDYKQLGEDDAWKFYENEADPWRFVRWTWIVLHWLSRESVNRKLSIYLE